VNFQTIPHCLDKNINFMTIQPLNIASKIDHTILRPEATKQDIIKLCQEAMQYSFFSVCVNSSWVPTAVRELEDSNVVVAAVSGFPLGAMSTAAKAYESQLAAGQGAKEIDTVLNIGKLKEGDLRNVEEDLKMVVVSANGCGALVKVILETCLLTPKEITTACLLAMDAGAEFVKTSTGFSKSGTSIEAVQLMRRVVGTNCQVKASGGIKDFSTAQAMIDAGADRLGTSSGIAIVNEELLRSKQ